MATSVKTIPAALLTHLVRGRAALDVMLVIGASVFIALAAQVAIPMPFSPVPLTLQPLAVLLVGVTLGSVRGAAAAALYLLEGFAGLPVFALGHAGPMWLAGPTAGYLFSYPCAAWLAGWLSERGWGSTTLRAVVGMVAALGVIYLGGWAWLGAFSSPQAAWLAGVRPFILADVVKVAIGASLLPQMQRLIAKI
ncbi:MAG: biotin transport system substrate-specific component [Thermoanaerobaculia bacterium]|jgi:biotin transport system substrate-specific component|nr:biotin transport system substrate-specific component [Thermoanaerobaculia bacterium]